MLVVLQPMELGAGNQGKGMQVGNRPDVLTLQGNKSG